MNVKVSLVLKLKTRYQVLIDSRVDLKHFLSKSVKTPDQSIVLAHFNMLNLGIKSPHVKQNSASSHRIYSFNSISDSFLNNNVWQQAVINIINALEKKKLVNAEFDKFY